MSGKRSTRLAESAEQQQDPQALAQSQEGGSGRDAAAAREFQENIVRRTNELFIKLNITTRPIQAFEELQKSASSMFVAIFETLFNVRLKNVVRKPRVVTDYITNADLVMTALSESLNFDLNFLSGEAIYHGDPLQINEMLSIFESLWTHLFQQQEQQTEEQQQAIAEQNQKVSEVQQQGTAEDRLNMSSGSLRSSPPKLSGSSERSPPPSPSKRSSTPFPGGGVAAPGQSLSASDLKHTKRSTAGARGAKGKRKGAKKPSVPKRVVRGGKRDGQLASDAAAVRSRLVERKKQDSSLSDTHGSVALRRGAESAKRANMASSASKTLLAASKGGVDKDSLRVLAEQYPSVYRAALASSTAIKRSSASGSRRVAVGPPSGNPVAVRMEADLERYKKAYNLLVRTFEADMRKRVNVNKRKATARAKIDVQNARTTRAQLARAEQRAADMERSQSLARTTREEVLVRNLFSEALKLENSYALAQKKYEQDEQAILDRARLDRYESLQQYFLDREALLAEKMAEEKRDKKVADYARRIAVRQLEQTLRSDYETKLDRINSEWQQREARERLSTQQDLSNIFRQITTQLQAAPL